MIALAAVAIGVGGASAFWLTRETVARVGIAATFAAATGLYMWLGAPAMPDQPLQARIEELKKQDVASMSGAQQMALLQQLAREHPDAALPHRFIGEILSASGRGEEAMMAYQSALRRDPDDIPSMKGLADILFAQAEGVVTPAARQLYAHAWKLDPTDVRAGFMAGFAVWQEGDQDAARATWDEVRRGVPPDHPKAGMLDALIDAMTKRSD